MKQKIKDAVLYIIAVFIPFLAVGLRVGMTIHFWINLFLTLVFFGLPAGTIHAWWVIYTSTRPMWYPYNSTTGLDPAAARLPHKSLAASLPHGKNGLKSPQVGASRTGSLVPKADLPGGAGGVPTKPLGAQPGLSPDLNKPAGAVDPALGAIGKPTGAVDPALGTTGKPTGAVDPALGAAGGSTGAVKPGKAGLPTPDPTASPKSSASPLAPKSRKSSKSLAGATAAAATPAGTDPVAGADNPNAITKAGIPVSENGDADETGAAATKNPLKKLGAGL